MEKINQTILKFISSCSVIQKPSPSDRLMSWPESRSSLLIIYTHFLQNFDKIWSFMITTSPAETSYFIPFALVGFEASKNEMICV